MPGSRRRLELAENRRRRPSETELQARRLADGAKTAYEQASKAVTAHQRAVSDLQKEYNELKETIDKALGIDKEIEDAEREVERADIRRIRAKQDLADLEEEIKAKEAELRVGDFASIKEREAAERELADLKLRHREAVLDVADAEDRYQDALDAASAKQTEKVEVEKALNGESVESAQARLDEIKKLIDEETEKLETALAKREEAQIAHENRCPDRERALMSSANRQRGHLNDNRRSPGRITSSMTRQIRRGLPQIPTSTSRYLRIVSLPGITSATVGGGLMQ